MFLQEFIVTYGEIKLEPKTLVKSSKEICAECGEEFVFLEGELHRDFIPDTFSAVVKYPQSRSGHKKFCSHGCSVRHHRLNRYYDHFVGRQRK